MLTNGTSTALQGNHHRKTLTFVLWWLLNLASFCTPFCTTPTDVDELRVVVLLLYPVTSWNSARGQHKLLTITNSLRRSFEGVLFVPLSLSSLYASHQLLVS
jgi:hypothetical protein